MADGCLESEVFGVGACEHKFLGLEIKLVEASVRVAALGRYRSPQVLHRTCHCATYGWPDTTNASTVWPDVIVCVY